MRMTTLTTCAAGALAIFGLAVGCAESDPARDDAPFADASVSRDDAGVLPDLVFESTVVDGLNTEAVIGDNAVVALDANGQPTIAYGVVPFGTFDRLVRYATRNPDGSWAPEDAVMPGSSTEVGGDLVGLGFAYVGGVPRLTYIGGDDDGEANTPYPTDLVLATRVGPGQWTENIIADTSADAPGDCPNVQNYCNRGNVVGTHSAIAAAGDTFVVAYRDTHFGFGFADTSRADVEVYASGLSFTRSVVDPGRSGGEFTGVALTPDDRPVVAYNLGSPVAGEDRVGVWAAVWREGDWTLRKLGDNQTTSRVSVAVAASGAIYVAYFDAVETNLVLSLSLDDGLTWTQQTVDDAGMTGLHPSLALDGQDRPVIAYTYCGRATDRDCPGSLIGRSEVRLARQVGATWQFSTVDRGPAGAGGVGLFNSLVIAPDGTIYVAFQDTFNNDLVIAEATP